MIDYTELKRLAEAAKGWLMNPVIQQEDGEVCKLGNESEDGEFYELIEIDCENYDFPSRPLAEFIAATRPDVTLQMIVDIDVQAGSIEAVQAANQRLAAERDKLRTQNQALRDDKEVLLNHMDTFMRVSNDPAIYNLAKVVIERFAQAEGGV